MLFWPCSSIHLGELNRPPAAETSTHNPERCACQRSSRAWGHARNQQTQHWEIGIQEREDKLVSRSLKSGSSCSEKLTRFQKREKGKRSIGWMEESRWTGLRRGFSLSNRRNWCHPRYRLVLVTLFLSPKPKPTPTTQNRAR